ncbi:MAG: hypothetical protein P4M08_10315 [Oligoflexia bacterium]|nr:hypothetical protein [Oligoflexia bacterium]
MELIIKPTQACNFSCTFCSSNEIAESSKTTLDLQRIFDFLKRFPRTRSIVVNGGDPLMMKPEYYFAILEHVEKHGYPANLGLTTNLWSFYKNPAKWRDLFRHPRVGVITSFQYGSSRRVTPTQVFTVDLFLETSDLMLREVGYRPDFISVMDEESAPYALENVRLAKKLDVECKLNAAMASGRQGRHFSQSEMYRIYHQVWKEGLAPWEFNTKQLLAKAQDAQSLSCPRARNCDEHIRAINPEGDYYSCGSIADDREHAIEWDVEMGSLAVARPLSTDPELQSLKPVCFSCEFFELCNGCRKTIRDIQRADQVEAHCQGMQALKPELHEMGLGDPCA